MQPPCILVILVILDHSLVSRVIIPEVVLIQLSFWGWAQSCSKHVKDSNKRIIEEIVRQVGYPPELSCTLKLLEQFRCDYHLACFLYLIFSIPVYIAVYGLSNAVQLVSTVLSVLCRNSLTWISNSSQSVKRRNSMQYEWLSVSFGDWISGRNGIFRFSVGSRLAWRPTRYFVQWVSWSYLFWGYKASGAWSWPLNTIKCRV
jgi:hypothetical protein